MYHCMAIWTDRTQVLDRVNLVILPNLRYEHQMVDVDVACAESPITLLEHETTDHAGQPVVANASLTSGTIAFL